MNLQHFLNYTFCAYRKDNAFQYPEIFDFDHVHPDSTAGSPTAILYGALGTECFKEFHTALSEAAKNVNAQKQNFSLF